MQSSNQPLTSLNHINSQLEWLKTADTENKDINYNRHTGKFYETEKGFTSTIDQYTSLGEIAKKVSSYLGFSFLHVGMDTLHKDLREDIATVKTLQQNDSSIDSLKEIRDKFKEIKSNLQDQKVQQAFSNASKNIPQIAALYHEMTTDLDSGLTELQLHINTRESITAFERNFSSLTLELKNSEIDAHKTTDLNEIVVITKQLELLQRDVKSYKTRGVPKEIIEAKLHQIKETIEEINFPKNAIEIKAILDKGRSMQGSRAETISYDYYAVLEHIKRRHSPESGIPISVAEKSLMERVEKSSIDTTITSLKSKLQEFNAQHPEIEEELSGIENRIADGTASEQEIKLIVSCKKLWMDLATEEGSYLTVDTFRHQKGFEGLASIKELAFLQSKEVDAEINRDILAEHIANRPNDSRPLRTLVEGAGPNGLYASMQLFRAGGNISIVNDRSERYVRNQIIVLDPKWVAQLNYLMGTKYDQLFVGENALGNITKLGSGAISTQNFEDQLKTRVTELSSFVSASSHQAGNNSSDYLNLYYEAPVRGIQPPKPDTNECFTCQLEPLPPGMSAEEKKRATSVIDGMAIKLIADDYKANNTYPEGMSDQEIWGLATKDMSEAERILKMNNAVAQATENYSSMAAGNNTSDTPKSVPFDFLVCVGGANDRIRDEYLSPALPFTEAKNYGVATWIKDEKQKDINFLSADDLFKPLTRERMQEQIQKQNFDEFIQKQPIDEELKKKYQNFGETLLSDIDKANDGTGLNTRAFENKTALYTGVETPAALDNFIKDLMKERDQMKRELSGPEAKTEGERIDAKYARIKRDIDKKWFIAIANVFHVDENELKLDPAPINVGTFDVQQKAVDLAAKEIRNGDVSMIITALGDSRASPHFLSGSGMSSGRMGIENAAELLKMHHRGELDRSSFVTTLNENLDEVRMKVVSKGKPYIGQLSEMQMQEAKHRHMLSAIHTRYQSSRNNGLEKVGYQIDRDVDKDNKQFKLTYKDLNGSIKELDLEVTESGLLRDTKEDTLYTTFSEIVLQA